MTIETGGAVATAARPEPPQTEAPAGDQPGPGRQGHFSDSRLLFVLGTVALAAFTMAVRLRLHQAPSGDEPAYLVISQTMQKYHSIDVARDYANQDYRSFYPNATLYPHVEVAPNGRVLPGHSLGTPLLWLVPYMLWGRAGACMCVAVVSVLIVTNLYLFLRERGIFPGYAFVVGLVVAVASPVYVYSSMTFVEPIAALLLLYAVRIALSEDLRARRVLPAALGLGYLPWVHVRFLMFTVIVSALMCWRLYRRHGRATLRPYLPLALPVLGLFALLVLYVRLVWGTFDPTVNSSSIGDGPFQIPATTGLLNVLFDRQAGLLTNYPIFLLVLPGLLLSLNRARRFLHLTVFAVSAPYLLVISTYRVWWAGYSPPARYFAVLVPLLAFYVAYALQRIDSILLVCATLLAAIGTFAVSLAGDIYPYDRFIAPGHHNKAMDRLSHLFGGGSLVRHMPTAIGGGRNGGLFLAWLAAAVLLGLALWLVGRFGPRLRARLPRRRLLSVG